MLWLAITGPGTTSITPADGLTDSVTGYLFGYGPLGICFVAMGWLLYRGWRLVSPKGATAIRAEARKDLVAERDRLIAEWGEREQRLITEKREAERDRDEAQRVQRDQLLPLLLNFTAATQALLPILQALAAQAATRPRGRDDPP